MSRIESGPVRQKDTTYRNPRLLALAKIAPHCMWCLRENRGDVVSAHFNEGKGMAIKSSDASVGFACFTCHALLDQGKDMTRAERRAMAYELNARTLRWLLENGHLAVV